MRVTLSLTSLLLLSLSAFACAAPAGEGDQVLGFKRPREGTSDEPPARRTPPGEQPPLEQAAELRASMLAGLGSASPEHGSLKTHDQKKELMDRLCKGFLNVLARSMLEGLIIAPPPPDLRQELLALQVALSEKPRKIGLGTIYVYPWDLGLISLVLTGVTEPLTDKLEGEFAWLRSQVFESMEVAAKSRILDLLTDLLQGFLMRQRGPSVPPEIASLSEIVKELEGELDKLENWEALEISKLISTILLPLIGSRSLSYTNRVPTVEAACLLTFKYLKRQLSPDLQEMADAALDLSRPKCIEFKYIDTQHHFKPETIRNLSIGDKLRLAEDHFGTDLGNLFDIMLRHLWFRVKLMELTSHAPHFPKQIDLSSFNHSGLNRMGVYLRDLRSELTATNDPRLQDTQRYYDLFTQFCGQFIQACREHPHILKLAEENFSAEMRKYLPGSVPPEPGPRVSTKGVRNMKR